MEYKIRQHISTEEKDGFEVIKNKIIKTEYPCRRIAEYFNDFITEDPEEAFNKGLTSDYYDYAYIEIDSIIDALETHKKEIIEDDGEENIPEELLRHIDFLKSIGTGTIYL